MSACSGNPANCDFCGTKPGCAKDSVTGCSANPGNCTICKGGAGCVAVECTGNVASCKACNGNFTSCRKAEVSASEGVEPARPAPIA